MKILHLDLQKGWRGGQQQLFYLLKGLRERGIEQAVACPVKSELYKRCKEEGFKVVPFKGNRSSDLFRLAVAGKDFDLIHCHCSKAHTVATLSKKFHKRPIVYTRRVDYPLKRSRLTKLKFSLTDKVVAISGAVKEVLIESVGVKEAEVIPSAVDLKGVLNAVNEERVKKIRKELSGEPLVGTLAALTHQKDIPNFIEAASLVLRELKGAKFVVFGEGKLRKELNRLIEKKGLKGRFILYGFVKEVPNYAKALDIFVLPSRNEGLGSSILIAMALKVPVVATEVGGVKEAVIDGETGILVPPSNPQRLKEAILELYRDREKAKRLTENAFNLVKERFTVESMVNSYLRVYGEVLGS
ncbi:glycosyltransferase family 4 protein [Thermovibrio sp.]